ncbi:MAG: replication factor C large subunit [Thermoplasmata archaeon]
MMPWADKYRPTSVDDLIVTPQIKKMILGWIQGWLDGNPTKKALILYGDQGIGKTSAAYAIAGSMGLIITEMNASDQRNRDSMKGIALMASLYSDIGASDFSKPSRIILIDEADNIYERGMDTGGMYELSKIIQQTRNPIIITMNDFYGFKKKNYSRDIENSSLEIEFKQYDRKRDKNYYEFRKALTARIRYILEKEGFSMPDSEIEKIIDADGTDIRAVINDVQSSAMSNRTRDSRGDRDSSESIYYIVSNSFVRDYESSLSAMYGSDIDPEFYLNWIDENLPQKATDTEDLVRAYDQLSFADHLLWGMKRKRHYDLMPFPMEIISGISYYIEKPPSGYVKYRFPAYINSMSRSREKRRSITSLSYKIGIITHSSREKAMDYLWFFSFMARNSDKFRESMIERLDLTPQEQVSIQ